MEIIFKDLKKISQKNNDIFLIDYLNSFDGDTIFHKFKNILEEWGESVSSTLNLVLKDKPVKISTNYLISEFPESFGEPLLIKEENFEIILDIPKSFDIPLQETLPIYSLIQYINISGVFINLIDLSVQDRKTIIDNLPAKVYNRILQEILNNNSKILKFNSGVLSDLRFNFLTNEPYLFLKGLFKNFGEDYFRDVIFHLSKRIDGQLLLTSTPSEIEYYLQKYSEEMKSQNEGLTL